MQLASVALEFSAVLCAQNTTKHQICCRGLRALLSAGKRYFSRGKVGLEKEGEGEEVA